MTTGEVLRRSPLASFGYGVLFAGSVPFLCLLGVPSALVLVSLVGRQLDGVIEGRAKERDKKLSGGLFLYLFVVLVVFGSVVGATAAKTLLPTMDDDPRGVLGMGVALSVAFAIALPYAFVPLVQRDPALPSGVGGHAFVLSAQGMTRLPLARRLWLVAVAVLTQTVPAGLFLFLEDDDWLLVAVPAALAAWALLVPLATAHFVAAYASIRDGLEHDPLDDEPVAVPPSLRAAGVSAFLSALAVAFLIGEALLVPLPMAAADLDVIPNAGPDPIAIGDGSVIVRSTEHGVTVAARDGGGAGFVAADCAAAVEHISVQSEDDGSYRVLAVCRPEAFRVLRVDGQGVRLDDSFTDRLDVRVSGWFWALLAVALLLWIVAFGGPWRSFQRARYLRSLAGADELDHAPGVRALEGVLHAEEPLRIADGRFHAHGSAQVSGGALRITLPAEGPALAVSEEETLHDGAEVAVVGQFDELVGGGFRDGPGPWPADGLLVPGGRQLAAERLTRRAARRLAVLFGAVTAAQLVAGTILVLGW